MMDNKKANETCCCVCELCEHKGEAFHGKPHIYGDAYYACKLHMSDKEITELTK